MLRPRLAFSVFVPTLLFAVSGCGVTSLPIDRIPGQPDAGLHDGAVSDGAIADGGSSDGGSTDGGVGDGSVSDGGVGDGGTTGCRDASDCDDGLPCNGTETCVAGVCHAGTPVSCPSDAIACTVEACDDVTGLCASTPDSDRCEPSQVCDPAMDCRAKGCVDDAACDDGLFCTGTERCVSGACLPGSAVDCADAIDCTVDTCDETADQCAHRANDAFCNDGLFCTGVEVCDASSGCLTPTAPTCDDSDACTVDSCDEGAAMCVHPVRDQDRDGATDGTCGGTDCNDQNASVNPAAAEVCTGGTDDDCDGAVDCADSDCAAAPVCNGCIPSSEVCLDFEDNDCDGKTDCADSDCAGARICRLCRPREIACFRLPFPLDTDCDNLPGCLDPDCAGARGCR